jgi:hypothetical protein
MVPLAVLVLVGAEPVQEPQPLLRCHRVGRRLHRVPAGGPPAHRGGMALRGTPEMVRT